MLLKPRVLTIDYRNKSVSMALVCGFCKWSTHWEEISPSLAAQLAHLNQNQNPRLRVRQCIDQAFFDRSILIHLVICSSGKPPLGKSLFLLR